MKRITYILTVIVSIFTFFFFFQETSNRQYNSIANFEGSISELHKFSVGFEYQLTDELGENSFESLTKYVQNNDLIMLISTNETRFNQIIDKNYYLYIDDKIESLPFFKTENNLYPNFTTSREEYISTQSSDMNAYSVVDFIDSTFNKDYQSKINFKKALNFPKDNPEVKRIIAYLFSNTPIDYQNNPELRNYIIEGNITREIEFAKEISIDSGNIKIMLVLSSASLIAISFCSLVRLKKEITIRKLFGSKNFYIMKKTFLIYYIICFLLFFSVQLLLYYFMIGDFGNIQLEFFRSIKSSYILYCCSILTAFLIDYVALRKIGNVINLKKNQNNKFINFIIISLKVALITLMISPFISIYKDAANMIKEQVILRSKKDNMDNNLGIYGINTAVTEKSFDEIVTHLKDIVNSNMFYYSDFSFEATTKSIKKKQNGYADNLIELPYIVANDIYLKDYNIVDSNNLKVDIDNIQHNTLLVPIKYKNKELNKMYCQGECTNIIYIKDDIDFYNNYPLVPDNSYLYQKSPIVLVKTKFDETMYWGASTLQFKKTESLEEMLNKLNNPADFDQVFHFEETSHIYEMSLAKSTDKIINLLLITSLYIILILIFQYETVFVYFEENKSELAVCYLVGKSYLQRYNGLLFGNIFSYIIPLLIGIFIYREKLTYILSFISVGILLELIITVITINFFERRKIISTLKGE